MSNQFIQNIISSSSLQEVHECAHMHEELIASIDKKRAAIAEYRIGLSAKDICAGDLINWCGSIYFVLKKDLKVTWSLGGAHFYLFDLAGCKIIESDLEKLICCEKLFDYSHSAR